MKRIETALRRAKVEFSRGPEGTLVADLKGGGYVSIFPAPDGEGFIISRTEPALEEEAAVEHFIDVIKLDEQAGKPARFTVMPAQHPDRPEPGAILRMEQNGKVIEGGMVWEDAVHLSANILAAVTTRTPARSVWDIFEGALGNRIAVLLKDTKLPS